MRISTENCQEIFPTGIHVYIFFGIFSGWFGTYIDCYSYSKSQIGMVMVSFCFGALVLGISRLLQQDENGTWIDGKEG